MAYFIRLRACGVFFFYVFILGGQFSNLAYLYQVFRTYISGGNYVTTQEARSQRHDVSRECVEHTSFSGFFYPLE